MTKRIIFQNDDGGISIIVPSADALNQYGIAAIAQKDVPAGKPYKIVDIADIPTDRTFRNAWKNDLTIDMPKAREIHKEHLRGLRKPKMEALDAAYMKADEAGNLAEKTVIAAKKKALRDVTADPGIDAALTPEELKAVMPVALK